jgi:hypothetical protein
MTVYEPNTEVGPTGEEAAEFAEQPDPPLPPRPDRGGASEDSGADEGGVRAAPDPDDPEARLYTSEPLEDEDGNTYVIQQQNVGPENERGGGEWPDPHTPPQSPAPGAAEKPALNTLRQR